MLHTQKEYQEEEDVDDEDEDEDDDDDRNKEETKKEDQKKADQNKPVFPPPEGSTRHYTPPTHPLTPTTFNTCKKASTFYKNPDET